MVAFGCLALVVLPLLGLAIGGALGGPRAATWSALAGLAVAIGLCAIAAYALVRAGRR